MLLSVPGGTACGGASGEGGSTSRPLLSVELAKKDSTDSRDCENCKFKDDCSDIERENCNSDYYEPLEMCSSV